MAGREPNSKPMDVRFWGVRGSIPSPGPSTAEVGGNTSCVEVTADNRRLIFDAGSGLRALGQTLLGKGPQRVDLFLSHVHWDHIQGLPFFVPLYLPETELVVYGPPAVAGSLRDALAAQMRQPHFPVPFEGLRSSIDVVELPSNSTGDSLHLGPFEVRWAPGNHPGGVLAYRVSRDDDAVVYATDTEHRSSGPDAELCRLSEGAKALIYDAMYTPEEYSGEADGLPRVGWGHSTYEAAADIAKTAGVDEILLFHHDPAQDDAAVAEKERRAQGIFPRSTAAREGLCLGFGND